MNKFRTPRIGSNVVHRLELPLHDRARARRIASRRRAAVDQRAHPAEQGADSRNGGATVSDANGSSHGDLPRSGVAIPASLPSRAPALEPQVEIPRPASLKDAQARHQIQLLERRLAKMARLLEERDQEIVSGSPATAEDGVASIYREVQGLGGRGKGAKRKRAFMSVIFEANLKLRERVTSASSDAE